MDWRKLTEAVSFAKTLDAAELKKYLTQLTLDAPDIGEQVQKLLNRAKAADILGTDFDLEVVVGRSDVLCLWGERIIGR